MNSHFLSYILQQTFFVQFFLKAIFEIIKIALLWEINKRMCTEGTEMETESFLCK